MSSSNMSHESSRSTSGEQGSHGTTRVKDLTPHRRLFKDKSPAHEPGLKEREKTGETNTTKEQENEWLGNMLQA